MLGTVLLTKEEEQDTWAWKDEINGEVSIKSGNEYLMQEKYGGNHTKEVDWLWNVLVFPKIQFFLVKMYSWLLTHKGPTN